jgi:hypothetical protein
MQSRFESFTHVKIQTAAFCVVTQCVIDMHKRFSDTCCLQLQEEKHKQQVSAKCLSYVHQLGDLRLQGRSQDVFNTFQFNVIRTVKPVWNGTCA